MRISIVTFGSETWTLSIKEEREVEISKMMCLRNTCGIRGSDKVRNSLMMERCG